MWPPDETGSDLNHAQREWAYDRKSSIGRLDNGLDEAVAKGWAIVDMKNDWNRICGFDK